MKTSVIVEQPLIILQSNCAFSDEHDYIEIYAAELRAAEVGKSWSADHCPNGRGNECESVTIIYKSSEGVAVLYRRWGTTDSDNPQEWKDEPELWWVELAE